MRNRATTSNVKHEIELALFRHADTEASQVKVFVAGGAVTLSGDVDSYPEIDLIEDAAWATKGVTRVVNSLRVA